MERLNSEGIPRRTLKYVLTRADLVMTARRVNLCLLCRRPNVNEAGLCEVCHVLIQDPEEQRLVSRWLTGEGP